MKPPFKNRPNRCITVEGEPLFIARDCAVAAQVFIYWASKQSWHVLLGKRGNNVPDFQGYWGFPCGYLDWDETLYQAVLREVWEETGLVLSDLVDSAHIKQSHNLPIANMQTQPMPWKISDFPHSPKKQNITHHFDFFMHWAGSELPALTIQHAEVNEAEAAEWILLEEAIALDMAFNHADNLKEILVLKKHQFDQLELRK